MGSHSSKAAKGEVMAPDAAAAADASPAKSNGQENGHVKINGDVSPKADGEVGSMNGSGSAEAPKELAKAEVGSGDAIEPAPVAEGEAKPDGAATKQTPKKKKRFSFKKSFKLSGISFRKAKKEAAAASPGEEQPAKAEATEAEDQPAAAAPPEEGEQAVVPQEEAAAPEEAPAPDSEPVAKRQEGSEGPAKEEDQPQPPTSSESPGDVKPEETSKPVEVEASPTADAAAAAEQKED
ncbi:MARCKS-related protein [Erythrolamprus reginae]|uniref:MARCKS-related protein n=1 Tax=Erythrolamprus reginae TaxID=121349 RepID=UPI00396CC300